jgi:APA family basic amino acid/polyamine antiporter
MKNNDGGMSSDMSNNGLTRKYGLVTATALIVGCIVGSGIFFRPGRVLYNTNGDILMGVMAWIIGGITMLTGAYIFAILATRYERTGGFVDYGEVVVGKRYGYVVGWFLTHISNPCCTAIVAIVAADFTGQFLGLDQDVHGWNSQFVFTLAAIYIIVLYAINVLSPKLAGKIGMSSTFIKLIPIVVIGIGGMVWSLFNDVPSVGEMIASRVDDSTGGSIFGALVATGLAYDGWYTVTSLNSEIKNSKRNLPIALVAGAIIVVVSYVLYFLGLALLGDRSNLPATGGDESVWAGQAFANFANAGFSTVVILFIVVSCLGSLNGNIMGQNRSLYSLAERGRGPNPNMFGKVDPATNTPSNAATYTLLITFLWLGVQLISELWGWGVYHWDQESGIIFDVGDIMVIAFYMVILPILIMFMFREKDLHPIKRFVIPIISAGMTIFNIVAFFMQGTLNDTPGWLMSTLYVVVTLIILGVGMIWYKQPESWQDTSEVDMHNEGGKCIVDGMATKAIQDSVPM